MQRFERATGSSADASEIEYVATIHQATWQNRHDGTITAFDVRSFLLSRYGIDISEEEARRSIVRGYGGYDGENREECIDLAELTAAILIPYFFEATRGAVGKDAVGGHGSPRFVDDDRRLVVREVLKMILGDVTGSTTPVPIDAELIQKILKTYGEGELARDDDLVKGMVAAAAGLPNGPVSTRRTSARTQKLSARTQKLSARMRGVRQYPQRAAAGFPTSSVSTRWKLARIHAESSARMWGEGRHPHPKEEEGAPPPQSDVTTSLLDESAFARAIAGDIQLYANAAGNGNEYGKGIATTNFRDVFPEDRTEKKDGDGKDGAEGGDNFARSAAGERFADENLEVPRSQSIKFGGGIAEREAAFQNQGANANANNKANTKGKTRDDGNDKNGGRFSEVRTANGIDFISDTHRSKLFVVILWAFYIVTQTTYLPQPVGDEGISLRYEGQGCPEENATEVDGARGNSTCVDAGTGITCEDDDFGCIIGQRVVRWLLIVVFYTAIGTTFITVGSWGNSIEFSTPWPAVVSIVGMLTATITPIVLRTHNGKDEDPSEEFLEVVAVAFGGGTVVLQLIYLSGRHPKLKGKVKDGKRGLGQVYAQLQSGNALAESYVKSAAKKKAHMMVRNAIDVHGGLASAHELDWEAGEKSYSRALLNFGRRQGEDSELCGGFVWTWHQIFTMRLAKFEGVLIPSKLLTANLMQLIMSIKFPSAMNSIMSFWP